MKASKLPKELRGVQDSLYILDNSPVQPYQGFAILQAVNKLWDIIEDLEKQERYPGPNLPDADPQQSQPSYYTITTDNTRWTAEDELARLREDNLWLRERLERLENPKVPHYQVPNPDRPRQRRRVT